MTTPLSLFMPVKPDTTLRSLIEVLSNNKDKIDAALTSIGTVHFARFLLLDRSKPNFQPDMKNLDTPSNTLVIGIITEYDGEFEPYIGKFASDIGDVFAGLNSFVVGGVSPSPDANNNEAFKTFIDVNDASRHEPNTKLYAAYPHTVGDILATPPGTAQNTW
jgi:CBS domain-containing protein